MTETASLPENVVDDTRNVILTFARVWMGIQAGFFRSKDIAADWAISRLDPAYRAVLQRARDIYLGFEEEHWDDLKDHIQPFTEELV